MKIPCYLLKRFLFIVLVNSNTLSSFEVVIVYFQVNENTVLSPEMVRVADGAEEPDRQAERKFSLSLVSINAFMSTSLVINEVFERKPTSKYTVNTSENWKIC